MNKENLIDELICLLERFGLNHLAIDYDEDDVVKTLIASSDYNSLETFIKDMSGSMDIFEKGKLNLH